MRTETQTHRMRCTQAPSPDWYNLGTSGHVKLEAADGGRTMVVFPRAEFARTDYIPHFGDEFDLTVDIDLDGTFADGSARIVGVRLAGIANVEIAS